MAHLGGDQVSITVDDYEDTTPFNSDAESRQSAAPEAQFMNLFAGIDGVARLEENISEYGEIKRCLLEGMGMGGLNHDINVVVHKISNSSVDGNAKVRVFGTYFRVVETKRGGGNANVRHAWYGGGGRSEVCDIISYGFGTSGVHHCHGVGVHLSPANAAIFSALRAEKDENGFRHMLLCRVILGNAETIPFGSNQFLPSSENFDSGIDNTQSPRKYIIWTPYMNSHILPEYIISFKGCVGCYSVSRLNTPGLHLTVLLNVLSRFLEPSKMDIFLKHLRDFSEERIQMSELAVGIASVVGDDLLDSVMNFCEDYVN